MNANNIFIILFISIPFFSIGQNKYPKDTIYLKYMPEKGNKKISNWNYRGNSGIYFSIRDKITGKHMSLFYPNGKKIDTLCISELHHYKTLNLEEIREKEINWVDRKFKKSKYKPYTGSKNAVFITYLIEVLSKDYFVIYPVIWRNEGVID